MLLKTIAMKHIYWLILILFVSSSALAQTGALRGVVSDQNGAVVAGAKVIVNGPSGLVRSTNTDKSGSYSLTGLPAGDYEVQASAPNLELAEPLKVSLKGCAQTRNPYALQKAPFLLKEYGGSVTGAINKRASFFLDVRRDDVDNGSIINAITLDPQTLAIINPFTDVFRTRQRRFGINPRLDYQLNPKNTLTVRYGFTRADIQGAGIGGFNLVSRSTHPENKNQTLQMTETAVLGKNAINETRFQFFRTYGPNVANDLSPAIQVLGSFNGGGAQVGHSFDARNSYELQNYTSIISGHHSWKFGARLRRETEDNISPQNFGGNFIFGGSDRRPSLDVNSRPICAGQPVLTPVTSIERYRFTLLMQQNACSAADIRRLGGGATQFSINAGNPEIAGSQFDVGFFVGDDWRMRPNLTLSFGLRYETQNNIHDRRDFSPRLTVAWAPGSRKNYSAPKTVIRAGFGVSYDRFSLSNTLSALRYNGIVQQQFVVTNPDFFPTIPSIATLVGFQTT